MASKIEAAIVKIASSTDIQSIASVHQQLLQAFQRNSAIVLDLDGSENIDLTVIQLIEAARRYADAEQKTIHLAGATHDKLREDLWRGGFLANSSGKRFWLHEEGGC